MDDLHVCRISLHIRVLPQPKLWEATKESTGKVIIKKTYQPSASYKCFLSQFRLFYFFFLLSFLFFVCLQSLACLVFISFTEGIECVRKVVGKWKEKKEWTKSVIWQSKGQNKKKKKSFMPEWMNWEEEENRNFLFFFFCYNFKDNIKCHVYDITLYYTRKQCGK